MKTLVLGPEEVREALNPSTNPRRQVFLVTFDGDIICCDIDEGWVTFRKPVGVSNSDWANAVRAAVDSLYYQARTALSVHNDIEERTEPGFKIPDQ